MPAGSEVEVNPDYVLGYDFPGYLDLIFKQIKEEFGIERIAEPDRFALFIDHIKDRYTKASSFSSASLCLADDIQMV